MSSSFASIPSIMRARIVSTEWLKENGRNLDKKPVLFLGT